MDSSNLFDVKVSLNLRLSSDRSGNLSSMLKTCKYRAKLSSLLVVRKVLAV